MTKKEDKKKKPKKKRIFKGQETIDYIRKLVDEGKTEKEVMEILGCSRMSLYYWARKHPELKKILKYGSMEIDESQLEKLGAMMCTMDEVAAFFNIKKSTLSMRPQLMEIYNRGKEKGKTSLRRHQFKLAEKSASMAIFLGKQYLGQTDQSQLDIRDISINWEEVKNYDKD